jgi:single-strand DNA-binding protein
MLNTSIIGYVGQDAAIKVINGKQVINFSVAHTESFYKPIDGQDVRHEKTTWITCDYWTESSKIAQYIKKGSLVYVTGSPSVKAYQKAPNELDVHFNLIVARIELLTSKKEANG